jgi:hypothetical protein
MDIQQIRKRATAIIAEPASEWRVVAAERTDIASLYMNYIGPLAAIPAVAIFLGLSIIGAPVIGRYGIATALSVAIAMFVSALIAPMVGAVVIEQLAPKFRSSGNTVQALKLVAYASTPIWVSGVLYIFILLTPIMVVAILYAIYLFYLGLPTMMNTPEDQVVPFMVVSALAIVVVSILLRVLESAVGLPLYGL